MKSLQNWMWGVLFTLILAAFGYAAHVESNTERRIEASEGKVIQEIEDVDQKVQWIMQHLIDRDRK
jgi:hypothetical protein